MMNRIGNRLHARSAALLLRIEHGLPRIMAFWFVVALIASAARIAIQPVGGYALNVPALLPYWLLVVAPVASMALALGWFADSDRMAQPQTRLAQVGRWRNISRAEAMRHPLYGTTGIMVSLMIGMLFNVPVRTAEYLASMPAITGRAPEWLTTLHFMMTLDVVLLSSLYTIAFVAALRKVPLFPRLLVAIWMIDLTVQLAIAEVVGGTPGLPPGVAHALEMLLQGNVKKVLISVALWLPYLLLSARVNVTFRHRVAD